MTVVMFQNESSIVKHSGGRNCVEMKKIGRMLSLCSNLRLANVSEKFEEQNIFIILAY